MNCTRLASNDYFGSVVSDCENDFDFTLLFEQSALALLPSTLLLLAAPIKLFQLHHSDVKILPTPLTLVKMLATGILVVIQFTLLVLWAVNQRIQTPVSIPASVIGLLASILILVLLLVEHPRSVRPSSLLTVYLIFTAVFDVSQARTLYRQGSISIAAVLTAGILTKVIMLSLETWSKRRILKSPYNLLPKESISGLLSRTCFWWLNSFFVQSFRHILTFDDLPAIDVRLTSEKLGQMFQVAWFKRALPESRLTLVSVSNKALFRPLLRVIFPRAFMIGFRFTQPFLISRILGMLQEPYSTLAEKKSYGLMGATAMVYLGIAISTAIYQHSLNRYMTMFRGGMMSLIFGHTLTIKCAEYNESAALTLMSTDIDRIVLCFEYFHSAWASLLEVTIGTTLLAMQLGWTCVLPLVIVGLSFLGNTAIASIIGNRQKIWVEAIQRRVAITGSMLESMKSIKMMGLVDIISDVIQAQRVRETRLQSSYRWMSVWLNIIAEIPGILAPVVTFTTFAIQAHLQGSQSLNVTQVFTSLSIITLTTGPAGNLLTAIPGTASCLSCFDRVQKYLLSEPREDRRSSDTPVAKTGSQYSTRLSRHFQEIELVTVGQGRHVDPSSAVIVENVSIKPASDVNLVLHNVSFSIRKGSILMVAGPVGCGKTTLLKALLGELVCEFGYISVAARHVGYCAQSPWLSNSTIQQNICGPMQNSTAIDESLYQTVVHACALESDFATLKDGDRTVIGSKGLTLSGGQKHRVALARALYARLQLYILDDVFSALDGHTERLVFERVLGPNGFLRKLGSTVILATHMIRYFDFSDQILVLSTTGHVLRHGSPDMLNAEQVIIQNSFLTSATVANDEHADHMSETANQPQRGIAEAVDHGQERDASRQSGNMAVYSYYIASVGWPRTGLFTVLCALAAFASSFSQVWLSWWAGSGGGDISKNISIYALLAGLQIFCQGASYWAILVSIAPSTARKLHLKLLKAVMRAPQSFFDRTSSGITLNRFSQDMTIIETQLALGALFTVFNACLALSQAGLIASGSYYIAATLPLLLLVIFILQHIYLRTSRQLQFLDLEARSPIYSHLLETLDGLITIRAFGREKEFSDLIIKHIDHSQRPHYLLYCIQTWLTLVLDLIVAAMAFLVVSLALNIKQSVSPGLLGISLNNILSFSQSLQPLVTGWTLLETSLSAVARVRNFDRQTEDENKAGETVQPPSSWPKQGAIEFRNLTVGYDAATPVLKDFNLTIRPGQKVGVCGRTGSGKSTLLSALLRLLDPISGDIIIDGLSLLSIPRNLIRSRLIAIPQDPLLLTGSLRLNIDPTHAFSDEAIIAALESVRLWPCPLATRGDGDSTTALDALLHSHPLSSGQAQLLALARGLLRKNTSKIVLLDEATSSVDTTTDTVIQAVLSHELKDHTVISIAHRLDTIMDADIVVVLDDGRVVELGKPEDLLSGAVGEGAFKSLVGHA